MVYAGSLILGAWDYIIYISCIIMHHHASFIIITHTHIYKNKNVLSYIFIYDIWYMNIYDIWYMINDIWYIIYDYILPGASKTQKNVGPVKKNLVFSRKPGFW